MFEMNIAIRHIRSRQRQTLFSVIAVALAVAIITISMSMLSGFTSYIVDATVENQPHVTVSPEEDEDHIYLYHGLLNYIQAQDGVIAVSPRYRGDCALQYRHNVEGVVLYGINPGDETKILNVEKDIIAGDFMSITGLGNRIIIGSKLAENLEVELGDAVTAKFPGSKPTDFTVTGIIRTGTQADETLAYANLGRVQDFYGKGDIITGIGVRVGDIYAADTLAEKIDCETGYDATSWMEGNREILDLIDQQTGFAYVFYIMIFAISGFGIANILIMVVMDKVGEIGMLMAMGTSRRSILIIFLFEACILGMMGVIIGSVLGYVSSIMLASYTIPVPPEMYFGLDHLPFLITPENFIIAGVFAMAINIIAGAYPARRASKMDPVEAIHDV
uniref:ABC transporter permease n=2 Tax=Candidatus Methanogaster sp. ANME-2c ERB4 TaxID=2759911 RepID=A0A7G9YAH8_9EURY|nr:hypothetical protein OHNFDOKE_00008 [Methanosarcinales archaeon ANME-2c ERB4]QNO45012.1 hypothetical protein BPECEDMP_00008 [Methanosarcinales archaeon ANME-2c ERB4]